MFPVRTLTLVKGSERLSYRLFTDSAHPGEVQMRRERTYANGQTHTSSAWWPEAMAEQRLEGTLLFAKQWGFTQEHADV